MSNLCVSGNTLIWIKHNINDYSDNTIASDCSDKMIEIKIKDLEEFVNNLFVKNLEVLSYNIETNQQEWKPITAFAETSPKSKVMKITDEESGKSIVVTPEHKVFTKNRGYVMAKDLVETDELVIN
tara:strand:- start:238 stop:615 length:378 start_codon:yes stop_codon:yes gene_type:complete